MGFGLGNIMGLAGDAAGIFATGGMDPGAWMDAVNQVSGAASGSGSSGQNEAMEAASSILQNMGSSLIQDATD